MAPPFPQNRNLVVSHRHTLTSTECCAFSRKRGGGEKKGGARGRLRGPIRLEAGSSRTKQNQARREETASDRRDAVRAVGHKAHAPRWTSQDEHHLQSRGLVPSDGRKASRRYRELSHVNTDRQPDVTNGLDGLFACQPRATCWNAEAWHRASNARSMLAVPGSG